MIFYLYIEYLYHNQCKITMWEESKLYQKLKKVYGEDVAKNECNMLLKKIDEMNGEESVCEKIVENFIKNNEKEELLNDINMYEVISGKILQNYEKILFFEFNADKYIFEIAEKIKHEHLQDEINFDDKIVEKLFEIKIDNIMNHYNIIVYFDLNADEYITKLINVIAKENLFHKIKNRCDIMELIQNKTYFELDAYTTIYMKEYFSGSIKIINSVNIPLYEYMNIAYKITGR